MFWKFASEVDLKTHDVILKHSVISGKFEVWFDGRLICKSKKNNSRGFYHKFYIPLGKFKTEVIVRAEQNGTASAYDLILNGVLFDESPYLDLMKLESLRNDRKKNLMIEDKASAVKQLSFKEFTGKDSKNLLENENTDQFLLNLSSGSSSSDILDFESFHNDSKPVDVKKPELSTKSVDLLEMSEKDLFDFN